MSDQQIEQEIQAKGLTAPRVTPQRIEEVIASEYYFTAADGVAGAAAACTLHCHHADVDTIKEQAPLPPFQSHRLLTFCVITLKNGFTVTGESACASPENFSAELGRKIARENAINKVWMLEGYLLKQQLHDAQNAVVLTDADALADLNGTPRPDNPSVAS
ncbi:Gp49 family protein [Aeromonas salmonicida]|uniref:Gp49 family protein n=1 Tax=Aeromonas salmonicida TaxID=645 RepID=UPI00223EEE87|nr:Gp49 family protein [Aeromonas salmonicida]MDF8330579.1 Gp49 family protein [Aeromonas salmonicida]